MDDDLYLAKIMRSILETFEVASVRVTTTYDETILILNNSMFDCIFVDNMMSQKSGLKLAKYIRQSNQYKLQKVPIILYTAFTGLQSILNARDAGITEILAKPISPEQIMEKMTNALFNQRDFIISDVYFGPDRRRRIRDISNIKERRKPTIPLPREDVVTIDDSEGED